MKEAMAQLSLQSLLECTAELYSFFWHSLTFKEPPPLLILGPLLNLNLGYMAWFQGKRELVRGFRFEKYDAKFSGLW